MPSCALRDDLVSEHRACRGVPDLLDVRTAEARRDDAHRLAGRRHVGEPWLSLRVEHDGAHGGIVGIPSPSDEAASARSSARARLRAARRCDHRDGLRARDGAGRGRLAGLQHQPEPARSRPRRACGVPTAAAARTAGGRDRRPALPEARLHRVARLRRVDHGVADPRQPQWRQLALAVPRARVRERRRRSARQSGRTLDAADPRPARAADQRTRDPLDRGPGDRGDRAGVGRVALRDQPGARLRDRGRPLPRGDRRRSRRSGRGPSSRSRC